MQEKYIQSRLNGNSTNSCKWEVIFFYSCCTLSAVVIFIEAFESFSYDIWVDEAFSLRMIEHSWFEIVQLTAMDVHPPLYYFILKLGVGITHNISGIPIIVCAKLVSVMPILILWIMNVLYIRPRYGKCVAGMFSLCITAAPNLTAYSVDIRMYGWGLLFVTATWQVAFSLYADGLGRKSLRGRLAALVAGTLLAAYTHYFALVSIAFAWLMLLVKWIRERKYLLLKRLVFAGVITFIGYLPWLFVLIQQIQNVKESYWIPQITLETIIQYVFFAFGNILWLIIFVVIIFVFLFDREIAALPKHILLWSISATVGTVSFGIIASATIRPVFVERYMVPTLGCLWFGLCLAWSKTKSRYLRIGIFAAILLLALENVGAFVSQENVARESTNALYQVLDFDTDAVYIVEDARARNVLAALTGQSCYQYGSEVDTLTRSVYENVDSISSIDEAANFIKSGKTVYFVDSPNEEEMIELEEFSSSGLDKDFIGGFFVENTVARQEINIYQLVLASS